MHLAAFLHRHWLIEAPPGYVLLHWLLSVSWVLFLTNMFFFCCDLFKVKFMKHCTMLFAVIYLCFLVKLLYKGFGKTNNMY